MSILCVYHEAFPEQPRKVLTHGDDIATTLLAAGVRFERWEAQSPLMPGASKAEVLSAYQAQIEQLKADQGYVAVDVVSIDNQHPERETLRAQFLNEHVHSEDEVRFFVAGQGLFNLHLGDQVYSLLCQRNDLVFVPAGVRHWFDMGERPHFVCIRLFNNPEGWVAKLTGNAIADAFPKMEDLGG